MKKPVFSLLLAALLCMPAPMAFAQSNCARANPFSGTWKKDGSEYPYRFEQSGTDVAGYAVSNSAERPPRGISKYIGKVVDGDFVGRYDWVNPPHSWGVPMRISMSSDCLYMTTDKFHWVSPDGNEVINGGPSTFVRQKDSQSETEEQSVVCEGATAEQARSELSAAIGKLEQAHKEAVRKIPTLPKEIMYRSTRAVTTRFDDRRDIIAEMIKNRGPDDYLQKSVLVDASTIGAVSLADEEVRTILQYSHVYEFINLAKRSVPYIQNGQGFADNNLVHHQLSFKDRVKHIREHLRHALESVAENENAFRELMDSIDGGWLNKLGTKSVYFGMNYWLGKTTLTPWVQTFSKGAGVASLVLSSLDILFAIDDFRMLAHGEGLYETHLENLEELAYLRLLHANYWSIELAQEHVLDCIRAGSD